MEFVLPLNVTDIFRYFEDSGRQTTFVAGGTIVVPAMRAKTICPEILIDISQLKELSYIREDDGIIRIGALTTISDLGCSDIVRHSATNLLNCCDLFANPLVRNRATVGGNLVHASPAADTAVPLLALDAILEIEVEGGKRRNIPLNEFFVGPHKTKLERNELLKEIHFVRPSSKARMGYMKLGLRTAMAISVASIALMLEMDGNYCFNARVAFGAVAPKPLRIHKVERLLTNKPITMELIEECSEVIISEITPITDVRASSEYRKWAASGMLERSIRNLVFGKD